jgi:hypothetical protein
MAWRRNTGRILREAIQFSFDYHKVLIDQLSLNKFPVLWGESVLAIIRKEFHNNSNCYCIKNKQTPWPESANELHRPSDHRLWAKLAPNFADRGCHVVSVTDPYDRILGYLDRSEVATFLPSSSSIVFTRLSGPRTRPINSQKIW